MLYCKNCEGELKGDEKYCPTCGYELAPEPETIAEESETGLFDKLKEKVIRPKADVSITLSQNMIRLNEELTGTLHVLSEEEFDADEVRVEVYGVAPKAIQDSYGASDKVLWSIFERASDPIHLTPGYRQEFPFSVRIPARPCYVRYGKPWLGGILTRALDATGLRGLSEAHQDPSSWFQVHPDWRNRIEWTVKGVIAVKGRRDVTGTSVGIHVPLPPFTQEEKTHIQTIVKRRIFQRGIPMLFIGTIIFLILWSLGVLPSTGYIPVIFLALILGFMEIIRGIVRIQKIEKMTVEEATPIVTNRIETEQTSRCPNCGKQISLSSKFCSRCGTKLSDNTL